MRGTNIADSVQLHRATTAARPMGAGEFYMGARWHLALTVGSAGSLRGFRPTDHPTNQFGALEPDSWGLERIFELTAHQSTDLVTIAFTTAAGVALPNISTLLVTIEGWKPFEASLNGTVYEATVPNITDYLNGLIGAILAVKLGRAA